MKPIPHAVSLQLCDCLQESEIICIGNASYETLFHFCVLYLRIKRKELKIRSYLCRLPSAVNFMLNLPNEKHFV